MPVDGSPHLNWDDVRLFLAIAERGSYRRAAHSLDLGHTTLSRRIEALENNLGVKLFSRTSQGLVLTDAGNAMLETAKPVGQEFEALQLKMFGRDKVPRGKIRLTMPQFLLKSVIVPVLGEFNLEWPEISVEVDTSDNLLDLASQEADIAVLITNTPGEQLFGRKVGSFCEAAYASSVYLDSWRKQTGPAHTFISPGITYQFRVVLHEPYQSDLALKTSLFLPDMDSQLKAACLHQGLVVLPCILGDGEAGLVRISAPLIRADIWLLGHEATRDNRRMQITRQFLEQVFADNENGLLGKLDS